MVIQQIIFIVAVVLFHFFFIKRILKIRDNILLGRDKDLRDNPAKRWKFMALFALGQKKMFKRPLAAFFHFLIYAAFIIMNVEILEIIMDGVLGEHRILSPMLGGAYYLFISSFEILAVLVIISCVVFLARRWLLRMKRYFGREMTNWPKTDATLILVFEILIMVFFLTMNTTDYLLQSRHDFYPGTGKFLISAAMVPLFDGMGTSQLVFVERMAWWAHILGIFGFGIYVTYSKHLHIFLAFPNTYFTQFKPQAEMDNMPDVEREVKLMMDPEGGGAEGDGAPPERFGAKDATDLSWKNLLDAYSCTECGRCTSECPANITGKKLSPRKIMMDTRDRIEEIGRSNDENPDEGDGKSLLHDYITLEELNACTTCQACVEACPVNINPLDIILQLRRYQIMEESKSPTEWNLMFANVETNFTPWKFSPEDRLKWAEE